MAWYVFALVDEPPSTRPGRGLREPLAARRVPGGFAIVERRADVPPAEFDSLRAHDAVVRRIAAAVPAVLPVRFGTLLELEDIDERLADRDDELKDAFDAVRGRVQFTWRGARVAGRGGRVARGGKRRAGSGTEYLRSAARAATGTPPAAYRNIREKLRPLVAHERYQAMSQALPDALYHLVDRENTQRYNLIARKLAASSPALRLSGPFPPFAFTPELL